MSEHNDPMKPDGRVNPINTDYRIGQDNIVVKLGPLGLDIHNRVFAISGLVIIAFVLLTLMFQTAAEPMFSAMRGWLTSNLDWFFIGAGNIFVLVCIGLAISPLGKVRLGGTEAKPDYSYLGWFSMLFAAGMGIGLMFYGVSEPLSHFGSSMGGTSIEGGVRTDWAPLGAAVGDADASRRLAMAATIYHWGLHPWAIYAILALGLALFSFNKGLPLTIRSVFYPLLGERIWGWPGHVIDILAVLATMFGLATSLGLGASQAAAGLNHLFGVPLGETTQIVLVIGITAIALISVLAGLDAGVKRLSEINMLLAIALLVFVIAVGPTIAIITGFFDNLGAYLQYLPALANPIGRDDANFSQGWTAFYWAWWISWSPFVGMFIARVSRGRTVREFIVSVLIVPSLACVLWMTVVVFFVTSSDSGSLVIDVIAAGGKIDAPAPQRVFWCVFEGLVAIALILGGGVVALQAMAVSTGFPFAVVLLVATVAVIKGLASEPRA